MREVVYLVGAARSCHALPGRVEKSPQDDVNRNVPNYNYVPHYRT